jgi:hypothetical protein
LVIISVMGLRVRKKSTVMDFQDSMHVNGISPSARTDMA